MVVSSPTSISCEIIPTKENTRTFPSAGSVMEYFPSISVVVPTVDPFNTTDAPGTLVPSSAKETTPL